ncbi:MAG: hypothetical protein LBK77_03075 [Spirochaetaceae bacterium]|jgi:hypothetical protein|nr:hypothetical protein [Spirochaetaceae bacterium]
MADAKKKTVVPAKKSGPADGRDVLAGELRSLIPRLDAEGLSFLVEQARIHLYNMQAEELNKTLAGSGRTAKPVQKDSFRLEGSGSGSSYYVVYNNDWIMFSRDEMAQTARIVSAPGTGMEIRERLYRWLERERRDVLISIPMADRFDEKLKTLAALIKRTFKVK